MKSYYYFIIAIISIIFAPVCSFNLDSNCEKCIETSNVTFICDQKSCYSINNDNCKFCTDLVNIVRHYLLIGNKTISDIITIIYDICSMIGGLSGKECMYIDDNIKTIVNEIVNGWNTTKICYKLNMCNHTKF